MSDTPDEGYDEIEAEYDAHREALFELVSGYAEEHDLDDALLTGLLLDLSVSTRMLLYAYGTEKPSAGGLKLELDRFLKDVGDHVREVKKAAEDFIADIKADRESN
ncbi:MAG: hypothetical protein J0H54_00125 [Rhizobiales bacterium]|nr:hypothetical protein [Hyphomicrobiales bacterium]